MYRRPAFFKRPGHLSLVLLLALLLALTGCSTGSTKIPASTPSTPVAIPGPAGGDLALNEAQKEFNEASKLLKPGGTISAEARAKYLRVVDLIEHQVLPQVKSDALKVTGYALEAFSRWQLGDNMAAIEAANQGKKLCAGTATNPRDCAMLQMDGGLVVASQAYEKYRNAPTMSREEVKDFAHRMEAALSEIDRVNSWGDRRDPITIYANLWQLMIIREATNFWYTYFRQDAAVWKAEVLKWLKRADQVAKKLPEAPYPNQDITLRLMGEFNRLKEKAEAPT